MILRNKHVQADDADEFEQDGNDNDDMRAKIGYARKLA